MINQIVTKMHTKLLNIPLLSRTKNTIVWVLKQSMDNEHEGCRDDDAEDLDIEITEGSVSL